MHRPEKQETSTQRVVVPMTPSRRKVIENFYHEYQFKSMADAVRYLIDKGLRAHNKSIR